MSKFLRFLGDSHLNNVNVGVYECEDGRVELRAEDVARGVVLDLEVVTREEYEGIPKGGANELARALDKYFCIEMWGEAK